MDGNDITLHRKHGRPPVERFQQRVGDPEYAWFEDYQANLGKPSRKHHRHRGPHSPRYTYDRKAPTAQHREAQSLTHGPVGGIKPRKCCGIRKSMLDASLAPESRESRQSFPITDHPHLFSSRSRWTIGRTEGT